MSLPNDIVLVRHGESEGNIANRLSKRGDDDAYTDELRSRHSSLWRLTDKGREQVRMAGEWIRENIGDRFDRYYVSEYVRTKESATLLGLPGAVWTVTDGHPERSRVLEELRFRAPGDCNGSRTRTAK